MTELPRLSDRESEVVNLLMQGKSNKQIASSLTISIRTVEFHLKNIYEKFQVSSRTELILKLGNNPNGFDLEKLGNTTGGLEPAKLGYSTVVDNEELPENEGRLRLQMIWATSLRESLSIIGKELKMQNIIDTNVHDDAKPMSFFQSIRVCLIKYADFTGQATRAEFWWFALFVTLVAGALMYLSEPVSNVFLVATLLPLLAVGTRRLHDIGRSGWWWLFALAPIAGIVVLLVMWAMPGTEPATKYN
jgi:DNA-binding CsgD family transcriptional regulator/uncharacterized membrane protein YhaH (DUF805 family)